MPNYQLYRAAKPGQSRTAAEQFSGTEDQIAAMKAAGQDISYSQLADTPPGGSGGGGGDMGGGMGGGGPVSSDTGTAQPSGGSMASLMGATDQQQQPMGFQNVGANGELRPELGQRILPQYSASLAALQRAVY